MKILWKTKLYKEQARLVDKSRFWIQPQNSLCQNELILVNSYIIKELEMLLENGF